MDLRPTIGASPVEDRAEQLVDGALSMPELVDIVVPRTKIRAKMRVASRSERFEANADARRALEAAGFPVDASGVASFGAQEQWQYELGVRILAVAIREPSNPDRALASIEDWRMCDDDQLDAMWAKYEEHRAKIDPLSELSPLTPADHSAIVAAAKKKDDPTLLLSFGLLKLASFVASSVDQPATSTTTES